MADDLAIRVASAARSKAKYPEKIGAKQACCLPAGHDGWHRSDEGSEWTHGDRAERAARTPGSGTAGGGS